MFTKFGRKVREDHEKHLAKTKFWNFNRLPWKSGNSLTAKILVRLRRILQDGTNSTIAICLQKMNEIYPAVSEIGPPSNCLTTKPGSGLSCIDDVTHDVTRVTSSREWRYARRHRHIQKNGLGVLSMTNFEFFKSDHYWLRYGQFSETSYFHSWNKGPKECSLFMGGRHKICKQIKGGGKFQCTDLRHVCIGTPWGGRPNGGGAKI